MHGRRRCTAVRYDGSLAASSVQLYGKQKHTKPNESINYINAASNRSTLKRIEGHRCKHVHATAIVTVIVTIIIINIDLMTTDESSGLLTGNMCLIVYNKHDVTHNLT